MDCKGVMANKSSRPRYRAILFALEGVLLRELLWLVDEYDRRPGQRFRPLTEWVNAERSPGLVMDNGRRFCPMVPKKIVAVRGEHSFAVGALQWSVTVSRNYRAWIGVVCCDAMPKNSYGDFTNSMCAYLYWDSHGSNQAFWCSPRSEIVTWTCQDKLEKPAVTFTFTVDLERCELRVARNGIPALNALLSPSRLVSYRPLKDMTIYLALDDGEGMGMSDPATIDSSDE